MQYLDAISKMTKWSLFVSKANHSIIQVYDLTSNAEEAELEQFYEDLQDLLELTLKKDVLFIIEDWNAKAGSQETSGVTDRFHLGVQNEAGKRLTEFCREHTGGSKHPLATTQEKTLHMDITKWSIPKSDWLYFCSQRWRTSIQFSSVAQLCPSLCNPMSCSTPGLPVQHQVPKPTLTHVHWVGDAIQPSHPLRPPPLLPSIFPSIRVFSNKSALHIRWPWYWTFSLSISPFNEYSGLISFRTHWFDLFAVQGTLKSLLQHHSEKVSILWHSAFFMSNSHIYTWLLEKP